MVIEKSVTEDSQIYGHFDLLPKQFPASAVTIGNFDGVHLGHRRIFERIFQEATSKNLLPVAVTFRPHPRMALHADRRVPLLLTYDEKLARLVKLGFRAILDQDFSRDFSTLSAQEFFEGIILKRLNARSIVVGYDFGFGRDRTGGQELLQALCDRAGVLLEVIPALHRGQEPISSSRIRLALKTHDLEQAYDLLGYSYYYEGVVTRGNQRGRTLGFPTANLRLPAEKLAVPTGVYVTRLDILSHPSLTGVVESIAAISNLGLRPTLGDAAGSELLLETHAFDRQIDLYGRRVRVTLLKWLREEQKFPSLEALSAQIGVDCEMARQVHRELPHHGECVT